jgi:hypothetical protein
MDRPGVYVAGVLLVSSPAGGACLYAIIMLQHK